MQRRKQCAFVFQLILTWCEALFLSVFFFKNYEIHQHVKIQKFQRLAIICDFCWYFLTSAKSDAKLEISRYGPARKFKTAPENMIQSSKSEIYVLTG